MIVKSRPDSFDSLTRRDFLRYSAIAAGLLSARAPLPAQPRTRRQPNIVMFISDDHGIDFVGCYGNPDVRTPNIDALAKEGTMFTRMFAASPTCAPSRSALYTGLYPAHNGCMGNHTTCRSDITALPTYLSRLGYRVVLAHKAHTIPKEVFSFEHIPAQLPKNPANRRTYRMEGLDTKAIDNLLAEHAKTRSDTPLCLIVADSSPHVVWEQNKDFDPAKLKLPPWFVDTDLTRKALANYYQDIATLDKRVGEVRAALKRHRFEANTLFIYTTDQGSEWPHSKWTCYDAGLHVPFIAVWPGVTKPGTRCDALISFVDVTPTFIDIAGGEQPKNLDGKSFLPVLAGKENTFRDYIYASHTRDGNMNIFPQRCVRDTRYKYILNLDPESTWTTHWTKVPDIPESHKEVWDTWTEKAQTDPHAARIVALNEHHPQEELYDTQSDPHELTNLATIPEMAPTLRRMRQQLAEWLTAQGETVPSPSSPRL
jgi:N-sulfoglucosamine sulfohydrolase